MYRAIVSICLLLLCWTCPSHAEETIELYGAQDLKLSIKQSSPGEVRLSQNTSFEQAFENFCLSIDLPSLQVLVDFDLTIQAQIDILLQLKQIALGIEFDPQACFPSFDFDFGIDFGDLSACLDFDFGIDFEFPQCNFEIPDINIDLSCFEGLEFPEIDFDFDINTDSVNQCLEAGLSLPSIDAIPGIILAWDLEAMIADLEALRIAFNPNLVASISAMAQFCGHSVVMPEGGSCLEENPLCDSECRQKFKNGRSAISEKIIASIVCCYGENKGNLRMYNGCILWSILAY